MENFSPPENDLKPESDLARFEIPIGLLAIALYVIERVLAFTWLRTVSASSTGLDSQLLGFFFGEPPYSILDILFGFDIPELLIGILNPKNIIQAVLQAVHFFINWWLAGLPFRLYLLVEKHNAESA